MTRPWLTPIPAFDRARAAIAAAIPVIETERLILRAPRLDDWETLEQVWTGERARYVGGPFDEQGAWHDFGLAVASWVLRGIGYWTITRKADGAALGLCGLNQEIGDPELEFGWLVTAAAEGQGYAFEAAAAVRAHLFAQGLPTCVSCVDPANRRSFALAERLGARLDPEAPRANPADLIFRHTPPEARP